LTLGPDRQLHMTKLVNITARVSVINIRVWVGMACQSVPGIFFAVFIGR